MAPAKRPRTSVHDAEKTDNMEVTGDAAESIASYESYDDFGEVPSTDVNTDEEITMARAAKSTKTLKRKLRATSPTQFGLTLNSLLSVETNDLAQATWKPELKRGAQREREDLKAKKRRELEREQLEERCRITDVIGGWGGESERVLRKVAQRGVIKLINAIQHTQTALPEANANPSSTHGLAAVSHSDNKTEMRNNAPLGYRSKIEAPNHLQFLDMIRTGSVVSKI